MVKDISVSELLRLVLKFRDDRNWKQFHNPKDVALSLVLEAGEVMEHFQWKTAEEMTAYVKKHKSEIGDELADVLYWVLLMAHDLEIDLSAALTRKLKKNEKKYAVKKSRGNHMKYTEL